MNPWTGPLGPESLGDSNDDSTRDVVPSTCQPHRSRVPKVSVVPVPASDAVTGFPKGMEFVVGDNSSSSQGGVGAHEVRAGREGMDISRNFTVHVTQGTDGLWELNQTKLVLYAVRR